MDFCFYFVNSSKMSPDLVSLPIIFHTQNPISSLPSLPLTSLMFGLKCMTLTMVSMGANAWVFNHHSPSCSLATSCSRSHLLEGAVKLGMRYWNHSFIPYIRSAIWDCFETGVFGSDLLCIDLADYIWAISSCTLQRQDAAMMEAARVCWSCFV